MDWEKNLNLVRKLPGSCPEEGAPTGQQNVGWVER